MTFAIALDDAFTRHQTPPGHPERPDRIRSIASSLRAWGRFSDLRLVEPSPAQEDWLRAVHSPQHIERVRATAGRPHSQLDPDTHAGADSWQTALLAAGSTVRLLEMVLNGDAESGFALVRPPGHHAEKERIMGFCLFNNVAAAAHWAIQHKGLERVAIVDFDVHHGNGTQQIFEERSDVLYLSTHQHPLYPGTGLWQEQGRGKGQGATVNFPIGPGRGNGFYFSLFDEFVIPVLARFHPQAILVSAGYDAHRDDPLANMKLDETGFGELSARLNRLARDTCQGRILYVLEGGYNLDALSASVLATIKVTIDQRLPALKGDSSDDYQAYSKQARQALLGNWGSLD